MLVTLIVLGRRQAAAPKAKKTRRRKARRVFMFGLALAAFLTRPQSVEIKSAQVRCQRHGETSGKAPNLRTKPLIVNR
jgi:hypothetical protein